jgi:hypothetical protein
MDPEVSALTTDHASAFLGGHVSAESSLTFAQFSVRLWIMQTRLIAANRGL